jgi:ubiquinone/menaquinone biosynthesis C-methylase UbiE
MESGGLKLKLNKFINKIMIKKNRNNWKVWDKMPAYGETLYKRAKGELEDMESAKSLARLLKSFYKPKMKVLDVGCGAGHYLKVFRELLDEKINYVGVDATDYYIQLARKAFGNDIFSTQDIFNLKFENDSFDIVTCNNVILHLPPPPDKAISELIRISKKYIVIRTVFGIGERSYIIKEVRSPEEKIIKIDNWPEKIINGKGEPFLFNYFNMYTKQYFEGIIRGLDRNIKIKFMDDNGTSFDNRNLGLAATRIENGKQIAGNLILDWKFIILEKN